MCNVSWKKGSALIWILAIATLLISPVVVLANVKQVVVDNIETPAELRVMGNAGKQIANR